MTANTHNDTSHNGSSAKAEHAGGNNPRHDAAEALKQDMAAMVADTEELLRHTVDAIGSPAVAARARLMDTLSRAKERTASGFSELRHRGLQAAGTADTYVRERTWQSIGLAALAGLVVGVLVSRRGKAGA